MAANKFKKQISKYLAKMKKWNKKKIVPIAIMVALLLGLSGYYVYAQMLTPASINKVGGKTVKQSKPKDVGPKTPMPRATTKATPKATPKATVKPSPKASSRPCTNYYDFDGTYHTVCVDPNVDP